ncbi:MAG: ATP-binding cassette domain-containing protein [Devosiaceae bacterium]
MIELKAAAKQFSEERAFAFDLKVEQGESLGVIGPSGSGKSTLLQIIAGFLELDAGEVWLASDNHTHCEPAQRPITMVFQSNNLFDHLDVATNVGLGISPKFRRSGDGLARVSAALAQVGLAGFEDRKPVGLSGGEAQRVALARALVRDKPILLLDEPFAALGPSMRQDFTALLADLQRQRGLTMITVSHAPEELLALCQRLAFVFDDGIAAIGDAETMLRKPSHPALTAYLGSNADL